MSFLASLLPALLVLGLLIIIHEFGHFIACRLVGVRVEKFSIGFGPELLHWQGRETRYAVSLFPLGGFVKPAGETVVELDAAGPRPGDYLAASLPARIFIVCAGVAMNYLLAYGLFVAIFLMGRPVTGTAIGGFVDGYPAKGSDLKVGDRIVRISQHEVRTWAELTDALMTAPEGPVSLEVERDGRVLALSMMPKVEDVKDIFGEEFRVKRLGIIPHPEAQAFERYGLIGSLKGAWTIEASITLMTYKAIAYLLLGKLSLRTVSGPVGIVAMTGDAAELGLPYLLQLTAILSISLAVINLLPIPALDGGHLLFLLIEAVRRKRVSLEVQENLTRIGFIFLITLMALIIYNDLVKLDVFQNKSSQPLKVEMSTGE